MNLNSLWGKNENNITNASPGTANTLTLESHRKPNGTRKYERPIPRGNAE